MNKYIIILFLFLFNQAFAQPFVDVKDPVLAGILCDRYPEAMVNNCTQIDLSKEAFISDTIDLRDTTIFDVTPLFELTETVSLSLINLKMDTIPDFRKLINLEVLDLSWNREFSNFPDFSTLTSPTFHTLIVAHTGFTQALDVSSLKDRLVNLNVRNNFLTEMPDLTDFPKLETANFEGNNLTFHDMMKSLKDTNTAYKLFIQRRFFTFPGIVIDEVEGNTLNITLDIDTLDPNNVYHWYKDGELYESTSDTILSFPNLTLEDTGDYFLTIKNPAFPNENDTLNSRTIFLNVSKKPEECITLETIKIDVQTSCKAHQLVHNPIEVDSITYELIDIEDTIVFTENKIIVDDIKDGMYELKLSTPTCEYIYPEPIILESKNDCDNVISPNGDGIGDHFFIEQEEPFKIIDKRGSVLNELTGPIFWDGTNSSGEIIDAGYYIILFESGKTLPITVER